MNVAIGFLKQGSARFDAPKSKELHTSSGGCSWQRFRSPAGRAVVWFISLLLVAFVPVASLAQSHVFYALGANVGSETTRVFEVNVRTLRVAQSVDAAGARSGMLTPRRDAIVLSDDHETFVRVSVPDLVVQDPIKINLGTQPGYPMCLGHTFVHPITGLAYFSCEFGSDPNSVLVVDTLKKKVLANLRVGASESDFGYDPHRHWLYVNGSEITVLDPQNHVVARISGRDVARASGLKYPGTYEAWNTAVLPNGNLVILTQGGVEPQKYTLFLYDPESRKVLRNWTETMTYPKTEKTVNLHTGKPMQITYEEPFAIRYGPVPSKDGSRLLAVSHGDGILFDASSLQVLRRWKLPEAPGGPRGTLIGKCFVPAPDGHGMWFIGQSGRVYRLDDHTGDLIEEVKLPFHLISLIRAVAR